MASAATSAVSFIDPSKTAKFPLHLGQSLRERQEPDRRFWSLKYNHKPRLDSTSTRTSRITTGLKPSVVLDDADASGNALKHVFKGVERPSSHGTYALIFDRQSKSFTLEPLAASYAFNITSDPTETTEQELRSKYGDALAQPPTPAAAAVNGIQDSGHHDTAPLDSNNPFDFRHYLSGLPDARDGRNASTAPSPAASPRHREQNVGLGITGGDTSPLASNMSRPGTANSLTPSAADRAPSKPLPQLNSPMMAPTITRKRKAPDIFSKGVRKQAPKRRSPPAAAGSTTHATSKLAMSASPEHTPEATATKSKAAMRSPSPPAASGASDDLLVIENDEPEPRSHQNGDVSTPPGIRPRSLRDIATSRDASPAALQRPTNAARGRGFLGRPRVDSGAASIRTDADVETDLDLGSPRWDGGKEDEEADDQAEEDAEEEADVDLSDDGGAHAEEAEEDGEEDELSQAIKDALIQAEMQADEEEVSEEE